MMRRRKRGMRLPGVGEFVGQNVLFSTGAQVLSQPSMGAIGQTGAQALQTGANIYFPIGGTLMGANMVGRQLKKLKRQTRKLKY